MTQHRLRPALFLLIGVLMLPLMITNESLWIDEGSTALFATQPDFGSWWTYITVNRSTDAQMPLSTFTAFLAEKVIGSEEWQLRAVNIVWGVIALLGMAFLGRQLALPWLPLLLAIQPYFWFYMNEARPFVLQLAVASWLVAGVVCFLQARGTGVRWALIFSAAAIVLCCATMLAPITLLAVAVVGTVIAYHRGWRVEKRALLILGAGVLLALPSGLHYVDTLRRGAHGAALWPVDARYLPFVFYELAGFRGIGPAVSDLRSLAQGQGAGTILRERGIEMAGVVLLAACLGGTVLLGWKAARQRAGDGILSALLGVLVLVALIFMAASMAAQKAFWARHFAPVFPFYVTLLGWTLARAAEGTRPQVFRFVGVALCGTLIASSLSVRFAERNRKDDYRSAADFAKRRLLAGESVWWIAGPETPEHYGVPLAHDDVTPGAFSPQRKDLFPAAKTLRELPPADVIVMAKRDAFAGSAEARKIIQERHYQRTGDARGFEFFSHPPRE